MLKSYKNYYYNYFDKDDKCVKMICRYRDVLVLAA